MAPTDVPSRLLPLAEEILGAAVALAIDEDLRHSTLRSAKAIVAEVSGSEEPPAASDGSSS
ncbi:MAG: hypothetical protein U0R71_03275 [Solirubrobacterales bacterium]